MLELLALAAEDGWAYVRHNENVQLVRPPYSRNSSTTVSPDCVATAVARFGFAIPPVEQRRFPDWQALIAFLNAEVVHARSDRGQPLPAGDVGQELLAFAPPETLRQFLDRVESELLPANRLEHAASLLGNMLKLPVVRCDDGLYNRATDLFQRVFDRQSQRTRERQGLAANAADFQAVFPRTVEMYGQQPVANIAATIQSRGTVFAI